MYDVHLRLIGNRVANFLLVLIELLASIASCLNFFAEALRAHTD